MEDEDLGSVVSVLSGLKFYKVCPRDFYMKEAVICSFMSHEEVIVLFKSVAAVYNYSERELNDLLEDFEQCGAFCIETQLKYNSLVDLAKDILVSRLAKI